MWHEARRAEKKLEKAMDRAKARAEQRRADYEKKMSDPVQLIRIMGSSCKTHLDAEQHYYHENPANLMAWQGSTDNRIDRFDGRHLLEIIPELREDTPNEPDREEQDWQQELEFERYRDLVENERLEVAEEECLDEIDEGWTNLVKRQQEANAVIENRAAKESDSTISRKDISQVRVDSQVEDAEELVHETDNLGYVDGLNEPAINKINKDAQEYGIINYCRMLRAAKRDRDEKVHDALAGRKLRDLKARSHGMSREKRAKERKERRIEREENRPRSNGARRRESPSYEPYGDSSTSTSDSDNDGNCDSKGFVIEFGETHPLTIRPDVQSSDIESNLRSAESRSSLQASQNRVTQRYSHRDSGAPSADIESRSIYSASSISCKAESMEPSKKLSAAEKLKAKLQARLNKQIQANEDKRLHKQQEQAMEQISRIEYTFDAPKSKKKRSPSWSPSPANERRSTKSCTRYPRSSRMVSRSRSRSPHYAGDKIIRRRKRKDSISRSRSRSQSPLPSRHPGGSLKTHSSRRECQLRVSSSRHRSDSRSRSPLPKSRRHCPPS